MAACHREERLSDVPLAITAITATTLQNSGARDLQVVINLTPGTTLGGSSSEANQIPIIHDQCNLNNVPDSGGQSTVAVFANGICIQLAEAHRGLADC